jgi:hypothetical protein
MKIISITTGVKVAFASFLLFGVFSNVYAQNVGINGTGATPNSSAMLDVSATDKGILVPRVSLTSTTVAAPVSSPATSLLVYNTNTAGDVTPGYYYWSGTAWVRMGAQGPAGPAGPQGPIGNTGPQGPIGNTGPQGPIGNTGPQGPIGNTGPQGPIGNTGPQGPIGNTGSQGPIGLTGATGATGATGPAGPENDYYAMRVNPFSGMYYGLSLSSTNALTTGLTNGVFIGAGVSPYTVSTYWLTNGMGNLVPRNGNLLEVRGQVTTATASRNFQAIVVKYTPNGSSSAANLAGTVIGSTSFTVGAANSSQPFTVSISSTSVSAGDIIIVYYTTSSAAYQVNVESTLLFKN